MRLAVSGGLLVALANRLFSVWLKSATWLLACLVWTPHLQAVDAEPRLTTTSRAADTDAGIGSDKDTTVLRVRYPHNNSPDPAYAHRLEYVEAVLDLVLSHSGQPYTLLPVPTQTVTDNRNSRNLLSGYYDVNWLHTNRQREAALQSVRIPLFKGVTGWRVLLIHSNDQVRFSAIDHLEQLKVLRAGQGHDWPDTPLLASHSFSMQTSVSRNSLISMLAGQRIDYFPRSVVEVFDELEMYQHENIALEQTLALVYPTAQYFFVAPDNQRLADVLKSGLEATIASGDFTDLFNRFYGDAIARAHLSNRHVFRLTNPLLPKETPLDRPELWLRFPRAE
jgi:hypothetical protein